MNVGFAVDGFRKTNHIYRVNVNFKLVERNMTVKSTETRGAVAVGRNLTIKGDYNVASDDCGDFDTNGLKTGLLVGNRVNYPLNTVNLILKPLARQILHLMT